MSARHYLFTKYMAALDEYLDALKTTPPCLLRPLEKRLAERHHAWYMACYTYRRGLIE